jgi:hypothetical protein
MAKNQKKTRVGIGQILFAAVAIVVVLTMLLGALIQTY